MIKIRQIKVSVTNDDYEVLQDKVLSKLNINKNELKNIKIIKKSIDARDKNNVLFIYEVNVEVENEGKILRRKNSNVEKTFEKVYNPPLCGKNKLNHRPVIVGSGPCGLFCTLLLAENGYNPILIERGEKVEDRVNTVNLFWEKGILNKESNVSFGEGGAGTFSDGKLNTLVSDKENRILKVFNTFVDCGAPNEILYINKPHIGTNLLCKVLVNMRKKIISLGGEIHYNSCLTDVLIDDNKIKSIIVNQTKQIDCDVLVLAIGHSARDTIEMLYEKNIIMSAKPFAVGVRVQHDQDMINESQYGKFKNYLPPASYKLTYQSKSGRGVYTFCMCPGGYVVNSSSEENHLIVNGMSDYERDSDNANSAVVVTVDSNDFGNNPLDGLEFQRKLENYAYKICGGKIPVQLYKDYKLHKISTSFGKIKPVIRGNYSFADLNKLFPNYINDALKEGIDAFNNKIKGFSDDDVILAGVESRTSSAVRIERNEDLISSVDGIYPGGEGAGYSGGITTSSVDGIKIAEKIIEKYDKISK